MKSTVSKFAVVAATALAVFVASCGDKNSRGGAPDTPDSVTDEIILKMDELVAAVSTVKDKESAEAAAVTIGTIGDDFEGIVKRLEALDEPSDEVKEQLDAKMDKAMEGMGTKMMEAMKGASSDQEAMMIINTAMQEFGKKMEAAGETFKKFGKKEEF